jgi:hypothetical protein
VVVCSVFLLASIVPASALTIVLADVADGWALSPDNFSTVGSIFTPAGLLVVARLDPIEERAALEFDISSLAPGASITSATLQLWLVLFADADVGVHGATGNGTIGSSDFTFSNQLTTFDPSTTGLPTLNAVDVTSFVAGMVGTQFVVFQLRELVNGEFNFIVGETAFNGLGEFHPRLEITITTPVPATLLLFGSGLAGLGILAWRRRR